MNDASVLGTLRQYGPLRCAKLAARLGCSVKSAWDVLHRLELERKVTRAYIKRANYTTPPYYLWKLANEIVDA